MSIRPDTIAAIATPPGVGAIAVLRISGTDALSVVGALAPGLKRGGLPPRSATLQRLIHPETGETLDHGLITWFPAPRSYTGEDVVEVSVHGGWLGSRLVLEACVGQGARMATPGEFTQRGYLNGKLDLVQVEAIADLIEARSEAFRSAALHQMDRGLSLRLSAVRERLIGLEALLVHHIDFPEEDEAPVPLDEVAREGEALVADLTRLLRTASEGELLREGAVAVLAGRPNAGKSSLFNALVGSDRAIVTDEPGTTRDAIEVSVSFDGFPFRLVDTAGLRETEGKVESLGIEVAKKYLDGADVVLYCVESGRDLDPEDLAFLTQLKSPAVLIRTMVDLGSPELRASEPSEEGPLLPCSAGRVFTSAMSGEGLDDLRSLLPTLAYSHLVDLGMGGEVPVVTRRRHADGLRTACVEIKRFVTALRGGVPPELASTHLKPAETALEEVLGVISSQEVLDRVFSTFCIGK